MARSSSSSSGRAQQGYQLYQPRSVPVALVLGRPGRRCRISWSSGGSQTRRAAQRTTSASVHLARGGRYWSLRLGQTELRQAQLVDKARDELDNLRFLEQSSVAEMSQGPTSSPAFISRRSSWAVAADQAEIDQAPRRAKAGSRRPEKCR